MYDHVMVVGTSHSGVDLGLNVRAIGAAPPLLELARFDPGLEYQVAGRVIDARYDQIAFFESHFRPHHLSFFEYVGRRGKRTFFSGALGSGDRAAM
jgi:hypothetical protein